MAKWSLNTVSTADAQQVVDDLLVAALFERLDLDLAGGRRGQGLEVADPGHDLGLAVQQRPAGGVGDQRLEVATR